MTDDTDKAARCRQEDHPSGALPPLDPGKSPNGSPDCHGDTVTEPPARQANRRPSCKTCRYWVRISAEDGECRRFPPRPVSVRSDDHGATRPDWPQTSWMTWCGGFEPRFREETDHA